MKVNIFDTHMKNGLIYEAGPEKKIFSGIIEITDPEFRITEELEVKHGKIEGINKKFDIKGNVEYTANFKNGKMDGQEIYFHEGTKKKFIETFYKNGKEIKEIKYSIEGKKLSEKKYNKESKKIKQKIYIKEKINTLTEMQQNRVNEDGKVKFIIVNVNENEKDKENALEKINKKVAVKIKIK